MNSLGEKVSYIKGLAQGLGIKEDDNKESKILIHIIDVLEDIVYTIDELEVSQDELNDYIETIDEKLSDIQNEIYDGAFENYEDDHYIEVICPHCDETVFFDEEMFDEEDDIVCPNCHENIYTEEEQNDSDHDEPLEF